jgi:hypothetical protein
MSWARGFLSAIIQDGETYASSGGKEQFLERGSSGSISREDPLTCAVKPEAEKTPTASLRILCRNRVAARPVARDLEKETMPEGIPFGRPQGRSLCLSHSLCGCFNLFHHAQRVATKNFTNIAF